MKIVLLFLVLLTISKAANLCPAYHCIENLGNKFRDSPSSFHYCSGKYSVVRQNIDNSSDGYDFFWVASCPNDGDMKQVCNIQSVTSNTQLTVCYVPREVVRTGAYKFPGESCNSSSECLGLGVCENGSCKGNAEGGDCNTTDDCGVGTYCSEKKCVKLIEENQACTGSGQCVQYTQCNQGKCTILLSLEIGEVADDVSFCKSYRIKQGKCAEAIKLVTMGRVGEMAEVGVCKYETVSGQPDSQVANSECGKAEEPSAYCPIGTGDDAFSRVRASAYNFVHEKYTDCHVNAALTCGSIQSKNLRGYYSLRDLSSFPQTYIGMMDNPDCVQWNANYYNWYTYTGEYPSEPKDLTDNSGWFSRQIDDNMTIFGRVATE